MNVERLMSILCQFLRAILTNDQEEAENTHFKERNPLKCHLTQIWRNITAASAFYNFHRGEIPFKSSFHLTMKNKERIRFEMLAMEDSMFDCEIAASTKLFSAFFTPYIWQMNPVVSYQYSKMTGIANENVYCIHIGTGMRNPVTGLRDININHNKPM